MIANDDIAVSLRRSPLPLPNQPSLFCWVIRNAMPLEMDASSFSRRAASAVSFPGRAPGSWPSPAPAPPVATALRQRPTLDSNAGLRHYDLGLDVDPAPALALGLVPDLVHYPVLGPARCLDLVLARDPGPGLVRCLGPARYLVPDLVLVRPLAPWLVVRRLPANHVMPSRVDREHARAICLCSQRYRFPRLATTTDCGSRDFCRG